MTQLEFDLTEDSQPAPPTVARGERWDARQDALRMTLQLAVPMLIHELHQMPDPGAVMDRWRRGAAAAVAERGDVLQYGGKKMGSAAEVFNHLARGLAVLAHAPGGVDFAGLHFEAHLQGWSEEAKWQAKRRIDDLCLPKSANDG